MEEESSGGVKGFLMKWFNRINAWLKPDPRDSIIVQGIKLFFKGIALLVLIALSPVILVVMVFVFFAAI